MDGHTATCEILTCEGFVRPEKSSILEVTIHDVLDIHQSDRGHGERCSNQ